MATNRDLLKEAIADAKAVKETAIANAKAALEEAFTPQLQSMFAAKLQEMEKEEDLEEMYGKSEEEKMEEAKHMDKMDEAEYMDETKDTMDEIDLEELLRELETEEGEMGENLYEAEGDDDDDIEDDEKDDEEGTPLDLEDMTDEDLKKMIEDVISDMIKVGELEAGHEGMKDEEGMEMKDEEEFNLAELLREIEEMESLEERKKYGGNKGDEKRDDMKKEKEGHGKGPKKKDTAEDEKEIDYKKKLKEELEEAYSVIKSLKSELNEINLLNAKLLYTNKIFKSKNLNENQKVKVLSSFDKATTVGEVKLVFETLNEGIKVKSNLIKENLGRASKATVTPNVKKPIVESNDAFLRMQKLAGII
jgi:spore coat protein CotF